MKTRASTKKASLHDSKKILRKLSVDGAYNHSCFWVTFFSIGFYFPQFYLQLDAAKHKLGEDFAFDSLIILHFASFVGRIAPGFFVDRLGFMNMTTFSTEACAAIIFGMIGIITRPD
ncbi:hypothetical protein H2248_012366 [Termitomyces sp. 'cryptogamus']|nr:hypothetical protein H2248_012366 [Termitomyces sp. 'cryptogamus']